MLLTHVARGQVPEDSGDEFFDLVVGGLPEEPHQGGDTSRVLDGPLVLVVLTAVAQVPEGADGVAVNLGRLTPRPRRQERDQGGNAAQLAGLGLDRVVHVAQVLEVRRCKQNRNIINILSRLIFAGRGITVLVFLALFR